LNFSDALTEMKLGSRICRERDLNRFIKRTQGLDVIYIGFASNNVRSIRKDVYSRRTNDVCARDKYRPTINDILAEDWVVFNETAVLSQINRDARR
jgi:hypothetical protein